MLKLVACFNPRTRTGCDYLPIGIFYPESSFNPRTRTGCDGADGRDSCPGRFNPRTRTGCDKFPCYGLHRLYSFNPRTRTGCDAPPSLGYLRDGRFQSTHPHGVRLSISTACSSPLRFNPRTRTGCDCFSSQSLVKPIVSIHAPARGATNLKVLDGVKISFQSTHPHGVRRLVRLNYILYKKFQSTHPHGVRQR